MQRRLPRSVPHLHHRTKDNYRIIMSMLSLQAGMDDDPRTRHTLEAAQGRVRAMMVVHDAYKHAFPRNGDGSLRITVDSRSGSVGQPTLRLTICV